MDVLFERSTMKKNIIRTQEDIIQTIKQYSNTIFKVAISYTRDKTTSEDILHDVLIKYMTDFTDFHEEEHKKAWLIHVTINECKKFYRSLWNVRKIPLEDIYPFNDPENHSVFYAIMDLPSKYRLVIHLHYYENMSIKEISKSLNIKENTVMSLLHRGRKLLKNVLEVEYEYKPV
jgi:RNA polymerase sigma-70 factor (ECF subfamily)